VPQEQVAGASEKLARAHHALHLGGEIAGAATARVKAEAVLLCRDAICAIGVGDP